MAWYFVKQPNGRLARYSDVVDDFTHMNMTESEARQYCMAEHNLRAEDASEKVQRAIDDVDTFEPFGLAGSGQDRWKEALGYIRSIHGMKTVDARISEVGNTLIYPSEPI